jgi:hypothetical protein
MTADIRIKHCVVDALDENNVTPIDEKLEEIMTVIKRMGK